MPWHARKFAARLQAAQEGEGPIFVHVWEMSVTAPPPPKDIQIEQNCEWLAFAIEQLGMIP
jgi:prolyl oligopeptidase